jgi:hypothetical protein
MVGRKSLMILLVNTLIIVALPFLVYPPQTVLSQSQILEVALDDLVAPIGGVIS